MELKVVKLGTVCSDRATKLEGTLTHWTINADEHINYLLQPKGLDQKGLPKDRLIVGPSRLKVKESDFETVNIHFEILGTQVKNTTSGFKGMAIGFIRHLNGCFHVTIQPEGTNPTTGLPVDAYDFDLRECTGEMIDKLSKKKLAKSKESTPSPTSGSFRPKLPMSLRRK